MKGFRLPVIVLAALVLLCFMTTASAAVNGQLDLTNCAGGYITVTITDIFFGLPTAGNYGCIQTGFNTNLSSSAGNIGPSATGNILNLNISFCNAFTIPGCVVSDFFTFTSNPNLHFDLAGIGPGPTSADCPDKLDQNLPGCAVFPGSPFILQSTKTGTLVQLSAFGFVRDGSGSVSTFVGMLSTQLAGQTPFKAQQTILSRGLERSTYSADFVISVTSTPPPPPPSTAPTVTIAPVLATSVNQVRLDASGSKDPNGLALTYLWKPVGTPTGIVINSTSATPDVQFTNGFGLYQFQVTVTNSAGASATGTITIQYNGR